jgi:hypothetical protein
MKGFGFRTPFTLCIPCPRRLNAAQMIPDSISFSGKAVSVRFPKNPKRSSGWWDGACVHQFVYHPDLTTTTSILEYEAKLRRLNEEQRSKLLASSNPIECGKGKVISLSPGFMYRIEGRARAGGKSPIFLLSPRGRKGTLEIGTNKYHNYNEKGFQIGTCRQWSFLPQIRSDRVEIDTC